MRSSTSNSDIHLTQRFIPSGPWLAPLLIAIVLAVAAVAGEETLLSRRGFQPTIVDSATIWARERARASTLGSEAIVLIGASRMQLDIDMDAVRDSTGREPVQLAIDGSSFVSVLADLADDDRVTGTILVDYQDHVVNELNRQDGAVPYLAEWQRERAGQTVPDFASIEGALSDYTHRHLRSYADGASPFRSLTVRALDPSVTPQYLVTLPSRERRADYRKVQMPQFYFSRVMRNAGLTEVPAASSFQELNQALTQRIEALPARDLPNYAANTAAIAGMVKRIEGRGGHVIFIMFPRSGLVREADERMFPRKVYWDRFIASVGVPGLNYADVRALASFECPDGSHLDARDQVAFTQALMQTLFVKRETAR